MATEAKLKRVAADHPLVTEEEWQLIEPIVADLISSAVELSRAWHREDVVMYAAHQLQVWRKLRDAVGERKLLLLMKLKDEAT